MKDSHSLKIRIKFTKYGSMKFIGHLDMMRYFQKCMRRANIDIAYTGGFSPHQIMSFAAPLGLGLTSEGEYLDIEVTSTLTSREAVQALNEVMVEGVQVLEYKELPKDAKNAMSLVAAADYTISFKEGYGNSLGNFPVEVVSKSLKDFIGGQEEILITKQTKKSEKIMDIKPLIYELDIRQNQLEAPSIFMKICTGSTDNIKPELVLHAYSDYCKQNQLQFFDFNPLALQIHRNEVYANHSMVLVPLGSLGKDILSL